ncbi:MAG: hypothetical protein ACOYON_10640 [Fimbriimonas sp.]
MMKAKSLWLALVLALSASALAQDDVAAAKKELAKVEKQYVAAKASYTKKPKDAKLKKAYIEATVKFGTATMTNASLSPREKYAPALRLYREALKLDPTNKEAANNKKMIEDIYVQMGRPIPK